MLTSPESPGCTSPSISASPLGPSISTLWTCWPSLVILNVTSPGFTVGSSGLNLKSVAVRSTVSPPPAAVVSSVGAVVAALSPSSSSSPPHAARPSDAATTSTAMPLHRGIARRDLMCAELSMGNVPPFEDYRYRVLRLSAALGLHARAPIPTRHRLVVPHVVSIQVGL